MQLKEEIERLKCVGTPKEHLCVIVWCADDVIERAFETGITISKKEANEIIEKMEDGHDATLGICWDTIDDWIANLLEDKLELEQKKNKKEKVRFT